LEFRKGGCGEELSRARINYPELFIASPAGHARKNIFADHGARSVILDELKTSMKIYQVRSMPVRMSNHHDQVQSTMRFDRTELLD
jgi:hypothetical protein